MVGALLLQGAKHVVPVERSMLTSSIDADSLSEEDPNDLIQDAPLPGNTSSNLSIYLFIYLFYYFFIQTYSSRSYLPGRTHLKAFHSKTSL